MCELRCACMIMYIAFRFDTIFGECPRRDDLVTVKISEGMPLFGLVSQCDAGGKKTPKTPRKIKSEYFTHRFSQAE